MHSERSQKALELTPLLTPEVELEHKEKKQTSAPVSFAFSGDYLEYHIAAMLTLKEIAKFSLVSKEASKVARAWMLYDGDWISQIMLLNRSIKENKPTLYSAIYESKHLSGDTPFTTETILFHITKKYRERQTEIVDEKEKAIKNCFSFTSLIAFGSAVVGAIIPAIAAVVPVCSCFCCIMCNATPCACGCAKWGALAGVGACETVCNNFLGTSIHGYVVAGSSFTGACITGCICCPRAEKPHEDESLQSLKKLNTLFSKLHIQFSLLKDVDPMKIIFSEEFPAFFNYRPSKIRAQLKKSESTQQQEMDCFTKNTM